MTDIPEDEAPVDLDALATNMAEHILRLYEDVAPHQSREQMVSDIAACVRICALSERRKQIERDAKIAEDEGKQWLGMPGQNETALCLGIATAIRAQQEPK